MHFTLTWRSVAVSISIFLWAISLAWVYTLGQESIEPKIITKVETKVEQKIEYIDRLTTRTIKGDTVTEIVHEKGKTETQIVEKIAEVDRSIKSKLKSYSVAAYVEFDPVNLRQDYQAMVGARVGKLPIFLEVGASTNKSILVGIKLEF